MTDQITLEQLESDDPLAGALGDDDFSLAQIAGLSTADIDPLRFESLPKGSYIFEGIEPIKLERVGDDKVPMFIAKCKVLAVEALIDELPAGKTEESYTDKQHNESFYIGDDDGLRRLIAFFEDIGFDVKEEGKTIVDFMNQFSEHRFMGVIKYSRNKKDPENPYVNLNAKGAYVAE